jgi:hypothetical protein
VTETAVSSRRSRAAAGIAIIERAILMMNFVKGFVFVFCDWLEEFLLFIMKE